METEKDDQKSDVVLSEGSTILRVVARKPPYIYLLCTGLILGMSLSSQLMLFVLVIYAFFYMRILMNSTVFIPRIVEITNKAFSDLIKKENHTESRKTLVQVWKTAIRGTGMRIDVFFGIPIMLISQIYILLRNINLANGDILPRPYGGGFP